MTEAKTAEKIEFRPIVPSDRALYEKYLSDGHERGCEFSFSNVFLWGDQCWARVRDHIVLFSHFGSRTVYPFPLGRGDKREVLDAVMADAIARGVPCCITGLDVVAKQTLERLYPDQFRFHYSPGSFDYVYAIDDLADLAGKKYHGKRNHLNRFRQTYPDYTVEPIDRSNLLRVADMVNEWYQARAQVDPDGDYQMEKAALEKALAYFEELGLDGLLLQSEGRVLAMTMASHLRPDTVDVHFEKARADAPGAYAAINYELARYIRVRYPAVRFLDREEDMGLEGLRRAKQSYYPHHMVEKWRACLWEDGHEN